MAGVVRDGAPVVVGESDIAEKGTPVKLDQLSCVNVAAQAGWSSDGRIAKLAAVSSAKLITIRSHGVILGTRTALDEVLKSGEIARQCCVAELIECWDVDFAGRVLKDALGVRAALVCKILISVGCVGYGWDKGVTCCCVESACEAVEDSGV